MDQPTFTNLTGINPTSSQSARFGSAVQLSREALEELLGWPLCPDDWDNQFVETGKAKEGWWSYSYGISQDSLDPPDPVVGKTRLFSWNVYDPHLHIDPATAIHAVKVVRSGITYRTFDPQHYSLELENGPKAWGKYVQLFDDAWRWMLAVWPHPVLVGHRNHQSDYVQVAVDADWAFADDAESESTLPTPVQKLWADMVHYDLNVLKRDIKSESMLSHSYTRNAQADPMVTHAATLAKYAGPRGTASEDVILV